MIASGRIAVRPGPFSVRLDLRVLAIVALLVAALVAALLVSVSQGEFAIPIADVASTLVGSGDPANDFIVLDLRLPRALTGILAGAALGLSGAIFQDLARNPLVAPDVIGVSSGASLAAISLIVFADTNGTVSVPLAALGGALLAGAALYGLAWRDGLHGYRLVLVGIGVAALLDAGIAYALTRGRIFEVQAATVWLVGSLNGRGYEHVWPLTATLAALTPALVVLARRLEALQLGDDVARALGLGVERTRVGLLVVALVLTAVAISAAGPLVFVAFVAPHIARRICGTVSPTGVLPIAALCGSLLVICADLIGRLAFSPTEIPVGIITAIIAAPYFLLLLQRANRLGASG